MATDTRTVRYVGPSRRGRTIAATGDRVYPAGVQLPAPDQPDDADEVVYVEAPSTVEVPLEVAVGLIATPDFVPVGWTPDEVDADEVPGAGDAFPRHRGGGHYELSDGTTVHGKDAALEAEAELAAAAANPDPGDGDGGVADDAQGAAGDGSDDA